MPLFTLTVRRVCLACSIMTGVGPLKSAEAWPEVAPADFSRIHLSDFADHELEVPYHLFHFSRVANAVVEQGEHRGFLDLAVNREPADNRPYNARIMEMQMVLAYFYTADRRWNVYRADAGVRLRLEAMLRRWARIQNHDGLFAEYSPDNWSLAPTNFGAMAAARALHLLMRSGLEFDAGVMEEARQALRRALVAMFTDERMLRHARNWSNQFSGAYYASLAYLDIWPDAELERLLRRGLAGAVARDQSPAGFFYEQSGPDFGYSGVHDNNMRVAWPLLRRDAGLTEEAVASERAWNEWLSYNFVPVPGGEFMLVNAGVQTRTSHAVQPLRTRVIAEVVTASRAFALSDEEHAAELAARRRGLRDQWGRWPSLAVPSAYAYRPGFVHAASAEPDPWHPTAGQRAVARRELPYVARREFNHQRHDSYPYTYTYVRRPSYYAVFNSGRIRARQSYGLGLLWHDRFGPALQTVAGTGWRWGTIPAGADRPIEQGNLLPRFHVGGRVFQPALGAVDLPSGEVRIDYPLGDAGRKTVTLGLSRVLVEITHRGVFEEQIPLVLRTDARATVRGGRLTIEQNGATLVIEASGGGAELTLSTPETMPHGLTRRRVGVSARDMLRYEIYFR